MELSTRLFVILAPEPPKVVVPYDELSKLQSFVGANVILSEEDFQTLISAVITQLLLLLLLLSSFLLFF